MPVHCSNILMEKMTHVPIFITTFCWLLENKLMESLRFWLDENFS